MDVAGVIRVLESDVCHYYRYFEFNNAYYFIDAWVSDNSTKIIVYYRYNDIPNYTVRIMLVADRTRGFYGVDVTCKWPKLWSRARKLDEKRFYEIIENIARLVRLGAGELPRSH